MSQRHSNTGMAIAALVIGVAALPVAAMVNIVAGLFMLGLPVLMVYKASPPDEIQSH